MVCATGRNAVGLPWPFGEAADIGNVVSLICLPEANWITGQLVEVDGGASLMDAHLPLEFQGVTIPRKEAAQKGAGGKFATATSFIHKL